MMLLPKLTAKSAEPIPLQRPPRRRSIASRHLHFLDVVLLVDLSWAVSLVPLFPLVVVFLVLLFPLRASLARQQLPRCFACLSRRALFWPIACASPLRRAFSGAVPFGARLFMLWHAFLRFWVRPAGALPHPCRCFSSLRSLDPRLRPPSCLLFSLRFVSPTTLYTPTTSRTS